MSNTDSEAKYIVHNYYADVKDRFQKSESYNYDVEVYENIIRDIKVEQNELRSLDKIFRRLIKTLKNQGAFYNGTTKENYCIFKNYIKLPEQNPPQPIEVSEKSNPPKALQQESVSQVLSREHDTVQLEVVSGTQELHKSADIPEVSKSSELLGSRGGQEIRHTAGSHYSLRRSITGLPDKTPNYELLGTQESSVVISNEQGYIPTRYGNTYTGVMMGTVDDRSNEVDPKINTATKDGFLGKVQGAFSSFAEHVEPGPVLGVSGGMGVLFLLFKYTPVGSFFGGRRGRFRQIPRSFGGFAPGELPNFQDYEGGYIGYGPTSISSLAE
ncbi:PIR protein [Plasmodium vivax]|uniref:VIR protein n=1 Tax=Plasmodium vivax TaxID=5855 RepID=A0A565A4B2_PLAVI|nr:PIR protein [Plasmodium vivax]